MAGAVGFEKEHYGISLEIGEKKLLPTIRQSNKMVIADGFSCREQIEQTTDRKTLHLAEVLASQIKS
jgi:Fe-S oxidoreductase